MGDFRRDWLGLLVRLDRLCRDRGRGYGRAHYRRAVIPGTRAGTRAGHGDLNTYTFNNTHHSRDNIAIDVNVSPGGGTAGQIEGIPALSDIHPGQRGICFETPNVIAYNHLSVEVAVARNLEYGRTTRNSNGGACHKHYNN